MAINLTGTPRYDTRGLPEGYDPHKFYEYRLETLISNTTGFESFLYKLIPASLVRSVAFAIDPTYPFKVSSYAITPANRTKWRQTASVLQIRRTLRTRHRTDYSQDVNYHNQSVCWSPDLKSTSTPYADANLSLSPQPALPEYLKDTTIRTRLHGSTLGTLELFKGTISAPGRTVRTSNRIRATYYGMFTQTPSCSEVGGVPLSETGSFEQWTDNIAPTSSVLPTDVHTNLKNSEILYAKALCQKHAISMLKDWSPEKRTFSFFRNLVELRDLPRSIASLRKSMDDLRKLYYSFPTNSSLRKKIFDLNAVLKDIPNEYLSYHFGWKQTYKDIVDLLSQPEKLSKKFTFLNKRNGKATTFRVKRNFSSSVADVSGFTYDVSPYEYSASTVSSLSRESEVRLVVNAIFEFPDINTPQFRSSQFRRLTGIEPRFTDVYNLVPWTWLVDWFTGFGNYVELIDQMHHDSSLVNWGLITCKTTGSLTTNFKSKSDMASYLYSNPGFADLSSVVSNNHTSVFDYVCQTRSDVATILDVNVTSVPNSLSAYQSSILGALLAQASQDKRSRTFRPGS